MRGMILAAGRGERMGLLTKDKPKPLIDLKGRYLIEYSLITLAKAGINEVVINIHYHASQIKAALGNGSRYGVNIAYSEEPELLETGGGILNALPLLGKEPFVVLSADVISDFPLEKLPKNPAELAYLVLVDNPSYHIKGDFSLKDHKVIAGNPPMFTFGNIGVYRPELFASCQPGKFGLGSLLKEAVQRGEVGGEHYQGIWHNLGTPEELTKINALPDSHF